ncbi:hypothetical protein ABZ442_32860 [Streptomyces triculaminicus]|uniref:hypothetical protein n=1 Tax=Streptomyces triculaminicus TaxID=2816232 RepID=UPI0033D6160A
MWGIARTLANEEPGLTVRTLSLERTGRAESDARRLAAELLTAAGGRFAPREMPLRAGRITTTAVQGLSFALEVHTPGLSYQLAWVENAPDPVGPDRWPSTYALPP